ncbi:MAG TPA: OB-fold nucleic acid binding domain-containing protein, partial [Bordetella sp.]|nr:OB-fold nucleic acid binding domain-containing protein [Bordetella sp.]
NGYTPEFAAAIIRQIEGFGEYGFPESHAASFALLAYASSWLKCHEPEAFLAALLNSQPMGFYAPAQLVQDARRHDVVVLPADAAVSGWEASLEALPGSAQRPAVRLGLNQVQGLSEDAGRRIEQARAARPFADTRDLGRRAALSRHELDALAAGDALRSLAGHRRLASWEASVSVANRDLLRDADIVETSTPALPTPTEGQSISADYRSLRLTLRRHPIELLRPRLQALRFEPAAVLYHYPDRRLARACGLVTVRQRPQTAKGTIFVTLEDETGSVNVIVRNELIERQRRELLGATLLGVYGTWQNVENVRNLVAQRLVDLSTLLGGLAARSRNFH